MIADGLVAVIKALVVAVAGSMTLLFPPVPGWATTAAAQVSSATGVLYGFNAWLPVSLGFSVAGAVLTAYVASVLIGIIRVVVSYFTAGGGAT